MRIRIMRSSEICASDFRIVGSAAYASGMQETLSNRIRAIRVKLGLNQDEFADRVGATQSTVSRWERGAKPEFEHLQTIAKLGNIPVEQLIGGGAAILPDLGPTRAADAGEAVEIIQLDLSLPMGPGASVDDYIEEEPRLFDLAYIRGFTRTQPHLLRIARGVGDSMHPTLVSSDLVWIDSTQTVLNQQDRIWAVSINGAAAIKRLRALKDNRVLVVSDNPGVDNSEVDADELLIGGRVIRFARDL